MSITSLEELLSQNPDPELALSFVAQGELSLLKDDASGIELFEKASKLAPSDSHLLFRQGLALFDYGSLVGKERWLLQAAKKFKTVVQLQPDHYDAWHAWGNTLVLLGTIYQENHYFIDAKEKLKTALALSGDKGSDLLAELNWDYGVACMRIGNQSGEAVDFQEALQAFEKSAFYQEKMPEEFYTDYGVACLKMGDCINDLRWVAKAINCFRLAVSLTLSYFDGWLHLARSFKHLYTYTYDEDHFSQAHECFSAAAHLQPASIELWQQWAQFLLEAGQKSADIKRLRAALEKCQRGYAFSPKHPQLLATWAEILACLGVATDRIDLIGEAQNKISEALELSEEEDPEVWHSYGKCLSAFGHYFHDLDYHYQSIEKFQESLSIDRTRYQGWYAIAEAYTAVGHLEDDVDAFEKGVKFYSKAIAIKPISVHYFNYASALAALGDLKEDTTLLEQALSCFEYCLQLQKNGIYSHPEWLFRYGIAIHRLGDIKDDESLSEKAVEILSQVLLLDPDFPKIHFEIGLCYAHLGEALGDLDDFFKAVHHFRLATKTEEENDEIFLEWSNVLIHISQYTSDREVALQSYREAEIKLLHAAKLGNEEAFYQLGCLYSLQGQHEKALFFLQKAHKAETLPDLEDLLEDEWLESLRLTPLFQEFISHLQL